MEEKDIVHVYFDFSFNGVKGRK